MRTTTNARIAFERLPPYAIVVKFNKKIQHIYIVQCPK